jgi:molybdopterin-guanine dinucleotide biosynthesis protein MobB
MSFVIGVCGYHRSGKTTFIEKLVRELTWRGYNVATIKNIHLKFSVDTEGKDTWRHGVAGSSVVVAASQNETSFIYKKELALEEIVAILERVSNPHVILVEGGKREKIPKIAIGDIEVDGAIFRYRYDSDRYGSENDNDNFNAILQYIIDCIVKGESKISP